MIKLLKLIVIMSLLLPAVAFSDYTCRATCIKAQKVSYTQSGNRGPSFVLFLGYKDLEITRRTKRQVWKKMRSMCDPYLLVSSYERAFEFGVGTIVKNYKEVKRKNQLDCDQVDPQALNSSSSSLGSGRLE